MRLACGVDPTSVAPQPPYAAAVRDWSADPFGGACHAWKIHERSWEVVDKIVRPVEGLPVYICGEAYSREQGWVQGALDSAERLLQRCFSLEPSPG